ncbi:MAG: hypothetical protein IPO09_17830 [Anaeromyxobacter sp.]|nr:hypothetical protein [Anaeromyxobacter sp.]MBL0276439.1 hypothetical protein [Anaeromyxobacter sp.]
MRSVLKAAVAAALIVAAPAGATIVERYAVRYDPLTPDLKGAYSNVLLDSEGGVRVVGQYDAAIVVTRLDAGGNTLWTEEMPGLSLASGGLFGPGQAAAIDSQGRTFVLTGDARLLVFHRLGGAPWDVDLTPTLTTAFAPLAVVVDATDAAYVVGTLPTPSAQQDVVVQKMSITMNPAWTRVLDRNLGLDQPSQLRALPGGGVVVAGTSDGALSLWGYDADGGRGLDLLGPAMYVDELEVAASGQVTVAGGVPDGQGAITGLQVVRADAAGAVLWTATIPGYRFANGVRTAPDGSVYVAGVANLDLTFFKYSLLKFSGAGQLLWERTYGTYGDSTIYALELDRGDPVVTGEYGYCVGQILTMKHSAAGDLLWQASYQPPASGCNSVNYGYALAIDANHDVHVAGSSLDFSTAQGHYPWKPTVLKYADVDLTPPVTTAQLTGTTAGNGWYRSAVSVKLTATDAADVPSGVKELRWSLDGGATVVAPGSTATVSVTTDGAHVLTVRSVDLAGNVEAAQAIPVNIDRVRPVASITASPSVLRPANGRMVAVLVSGSASDARSGVAAATFTVTDEYGLVQPALTGFGQTILLQASRRASDGNGRVYTIAVRVTDLAGNVTTASTRVTVP